VQDFTPYDVISVTINTDVKDEAGDNLQNTYAFSFTVKDIVNETVAQNVSEDVSVGGNTITVNFTKAGDVGFVTMNDPGYSGLPVTGALFYDIDHSDSSAQGKFVFHYSGSDIVGIDEDTLEVYHWNGSEWSEIGSTVDTSANTITTTEYTTLSVFAIGGAPVRDGGRTSSPLFGWLELFLVFGAALVVYAYKAK